MELGFLGSVMHVKLPHTVDEQQLTETSSFHEKFDPSLHVGLSRILICFHLMAHSQPNPQILASSAPWTPPPLDLFEACLSNLWTIWECVVLCEPILVFGPSPALTSQAIWWFRDLLRPVRLQIGMLSYAPLTDSLVHRFP